MEKYYPIVVPLILSSVVQLMCQRDGPVYSNGVHFQPPGYVFGIVWTGLYILLGFYLKALLESPNSLLLILYGLNMVVNLAWMPVVNNYGKLKLGIFMIAAMFCATLAMSLLDSQPHRRVLLAPYLTWLIVAMLLNVELSREGH